MPKSSPTCNKCEDEAWQERIALAEDAQEQSSRMFRSVEEAAHSASYHQDEAKRAEEHAKVVQGFVLQEVAAA